MSPPATAGRGGAKVKTRTCFLPGGLIEYIRVKVGRETGSVTYIGVTHTYPAGRHTAHDLKFAHIFGNNSASSHDSAGSDRHARKNSRARADPCVITDGYRGTDSGEHRVIVVVMQAQDTNLKRHIDVVANYYTYSPIQIYISVNYAIVSN